MKNIGILVYMYHIEISIHFTQADRLCVFIFYILQNKNTTTLKATNKKKCKFKNKVEKKLVDLLVRVLDHYNH
jgi:hypothetical protein